MVDIVLQKARFLFGFRIFVVALISDRSVSIRFFG